MPNLGGGMMDSALAASGGINEYAGLRESFRKSRPVKRRRLVDINRRPELADALRGKMVRIWSDEHKAWWRANGSGYTNVLPAAGLYTFEDAWARTHHCGPEKKIVYVVGVPILVIDNKDAAALLKALTAIAEGYPVQVADDRYIVVKNPDFQEDNGQDPNLVIDVFALKGKIDG